MVSACAWPCMHAWVHTRCTMHVGRCLRGTVSLNTVILTVSVIVTHVQHIMQHTHVHVQHKIKTTRACMPFVYSRSKHIFAAKPRYSRRKFFWGTGFCIESKCKTPSCQQPVLRKENLPGTGFPLVPDLLTPPLPAPPIHIKTDVGNVALTCQPCLLVDST